MLNYEDEALRTFGNTIETKLNVIYFSSRQTLERGLYLENGTIYYAGADGVHAVIDTGELNLLGTHNYENVMAACAVTHALGVPFEKIREVLKIFRAVAHRIEYVGEINGVRYYNDSKATNPDAAIKGIRAMERPTWLIGGGYDKQSEYGLQKKKLQRKRRKKDLQRLSCAILWKTPSHTATATRARRTQCFCLLRVQAGICFQIMKREGTFLKKLYEATSSKAAK